MDRRVAALPEVTSTSLPHAFLLPDFETDRRSSQHSGGVHEIGLSHCPEYRRGYRILAIFAPEPTAAPRSKRSGVQ